MGSPRSLVLAWKGCCLCWKGSWIRLWWLIVMVVGVAGVMGPLISVYPPAFVQEKMCAPASSGNSNNEHDKGAKQSCLTECCPLLWSDQQELLDLPTSHLLARLIHIARWEYVIIVFDDEYESEVAELTTHVSEAHATFMLFRYSALATMPGGLDNLIHTGSDSWLQRLHFVLFCSQPHAIHLLSRADEFQAREKMRSALFMTSQWLILENPEDDQRLDLTRFTMTNVAKVRCHPGGSCCQMSDETSSDCGQVYTLVWREEARWVQCLGTVPSVVCTGDLVFPGTQWGFNRRLLTVSTLTWEGFSEHVAKKNGGELSYMGLCVDLLNELAFQLNFTYHLSEPADGIWGIRYENGTWAGLIGQLAYSQVDLVIAPLTITQQRENVMDFTYAYFNDADTVIYKKPDPDKHKWKTYLQPLKWQVLVCIAISMVVSSFLLGCIESWTPFYPSNRLKDHRGHHSCYFRAFRLVYGALLAQADEQLPRSHSGRMLVSCWWLFSIVVAATYSGNLIAFLTVDKTKPLFTTLKDLLEQDVYRWGFLGGSAIHHTVRASNSSLYSAIWVGVKKWLSQNPDHLATNISLHYQRLLHGDYAFVSDRATFDRWTANRCDLELAKETFLPTEYGVGLPNDSAFTRVFSSEILMMHENGWLEKVREKWWPHQSFCEPSTTTRSTPITLVHVQSLFYILLIGAFLALVALSVEYFVMLPAWAKLRKSLLLQKALRNDGQTEGK